MGRNSQERMTGMSYRKRVNRAKKRGFKGRIAQLLRINKGQPMFLANNSRAGKYVPKILRNMVYGVGEHVE